MQAHEFSESQIANLLFLFDLSDTIKCHATNL